MATKLFKAGHVWTLPKGLSWGVCITNYWRV
jgi:hypothetical protein